MSKARVPKNPKLPGATSRKAAWLALAMEETLASLAQIHDPRYQPNVEYPLPSVLALIFSAVICGADNPTEIERFGIDREKVLRRHLTFPEQMPTHDTVTRVLRLLDPRVVDGAFRAWVEAVRERRVGRLICIDGKTSRGAVARGEVQPHVHLVNAFCVESGTLLGQVKTAEKSSELTAIPELLALVNVRGAVVSIDAAGCHTSVAAAIVERGGSYLLALKENQPKLYADAVALCTDHGSAQRLASGCEVIEKKKRHGRIETRRAWVYRDVAELHRAEEFPKLSAIVRIEAIRRIGDKESREDRYYITSQKNLTAELALHQTRRHWAIENELHWMLDVVFREDDQKVQAAAVVANLSRLRATALQVLKLHKLPGVSAAGMRKSAGWSEEVFERIVFGVQ